MIDTDIVIDRKQPSVYTKNILNFLKIVIELLKLTK